MTAAAMPPRTARSLALVAALLIPRQAGAADAAWFPVRTNPWFADVRQELQALVDANGHHRTDRICVVGDDVHGSTYMLTRTEADADIAACQKHGTTYVVTRRAGGQRAGN